MAEARGAAAPWPGRLLALRHGHAAEQGVRHPRHLHFSEVEVGGWRAEARQHVARPPGRSPRQAEVNFDLALSAQRSHSASANAAFWRYANDWGHRALVVVCFGAGVTWALLASWWALLARIPAGV